MSKRGAGSYLTHDNWDEDDDKEEAGEFKQADDKTMQTRKIKTAKRRGVGEQAKESSGTGGIFKGFTGFSSATGGDKPAFSFGQTKPLGGLDAKPLGVIDPKPFTFGSTAEEAKPAASTTQEAKPLVSSSSSSNGTASADKDDKAASAKSSPEKNGTTSKPASSSNSKCLSQLKALNETVSKWIKEHVDKNPYVILTPVFSDYKTHLAEIERKYGDSAANSSGGGEGAPPGVGKDQEKTATVESLSGTKSTFSFGSFASSSTGTTTTTTSSTTTAATSGFTFGAAASKAFGATSSSTTTETPSTTPSTTSASSSVFGASATPAFSAGFTFGKADSTTTSSSSSTGGFSFGKTDSGAAGTGGFSFGAGAALVGAPAAASGDAQKEEEDEYVPPKPESSSIVEEDAFYTKRCKLFYKLEGDWKDRGVGLLYLKPCDDKTQLLIRADTSIGNILLNVMLQKSMPVNRHGKNNVMSMCIPNPPLDEKKPDDKTPVSLLIRVKTGEDADELAGKLTELKDKE